MKPLKILQKIKEYFDVAAGNHVFSFNMIKGQKIY